MSTHLRLLGKLLRIFCNVMIIVSVVSTLPGCHQKNHDESLTSAEEKVKLNTTDPRWVFRNANSPQKTAVVFVHGIFGDTLGTWTNPNGQTFFDLLRKSPELKGSIDVYAFGFTSKMFGGGSLSIREAAAKLDESLTFDHVWDYPSVVFVAHSMGGLVVIRELTHVPKRLEQTPLVMLFATPSTGAQISTIGNLFLQNPALEQMRPSDGNEYLKQLDDDWTDTVHPGTRVVCAYETKPLGPVLVVPWSGSSRHCDEAAHAIEDTTHLTIVKPDRPKHPSVVVLVNAMNKYVFSADRDEGIDTPSFSREGGNWSFKIMDLNHANPALVINRGPRQVHYDVVNVSPGVWVDPRDENIAANGKATLDVIIMRGELLGSYSFELKVEPLPPWHVNVVLPDIQAIQAQQQALASNLSIALSRYLSAGDTLTRLNKRPAKVQLHDVAEIARQTIAKGHDNLPLRVQWLVTADALTSLGWPNLGGAALDEMNQADPAFGQTAVAQMVGARVAALNGHPGMFSWVLPTNRRTIDEMEIQAPTLWPTALSAADAQRLSRSFQLIGALKSNGLMLQGDIFKAQGQTERARNAYFDATKIQNSIILNQKIKSLKNMRLEKNG